MRARYWQKGEVLDYKNETEEVIPENTAVLIGSRLGVTGTLIAPGEIGSLHITGVFELESTAEKIEIGQTVYYDVDADKITVTAGSNVQVGFAAASFEEEETKVLVKIG